MRLSAAFITACMVVIATALAVTAYLLFGFSPTEAGATGLALLAMLAVTNAFSSDRAADPPDFARQIAALSQGTADLAHQVKELGRRVAMLEHAPAGRDDTEAVRAATEPLAAEIEVLGTLVNRLAESVAAHEAALVDVLTATAEPVIHPPLAATSQQSSVAPAAPPPVPVLVARSAPPANPPHAVKPDAPAFSALDPDIEIAPDTDLLMALAPLADAATTIIREALLANRLDLYLQPIVTLPQRKVRFYEGFTRLRTAEGETLAPADYLAPAERGGLLPLLDTTMLLRSAQVARRLSASNRDAGLFCNIAAATLRDAAAFSQVFEFLSANRAHAPALILEFAQATLRTIGPAEREGLARLSALGFRFSIDRVTDLQVDPRELAERGVRFVKAPAALLLDPAGPATDIHAADLANLLARYGIDLIAEKIDSEDVCVDLLDYDIRFGQGFLFSAPRPVRAEVFQAPAEQPPLPVQETPAAATAEPPQPKSADAALPPAARRRERDLDTAPATGARTQTALAQLAREMMRRA